MSMKLSDGEKGPGWEATAFWLLALVITGTVVWLSVSPATFPKQVLDLVKIPWTRLVIGLVAGVIGIRMQGAASYVLTMLAAIVIVTSATQLLGWR